MWHIPDWDELHTSCNATLQGGSMTVSNEATQLRQSVLTLLDIEREQMLERFGFEVREGGHFTVRKSGQSKSDTNRPFVFGLIDGTRSDPS
jgi:hypothetical protein